MTLSRNQSTGKAILSAVGVLLFWLLLVGFLLYMPPLISALWMIAVGVAFTYWVVFPSATKERALTSLSLGDFTVQRISPFVLAGVLAASLSVTTQVWYTTLFPSTSPPIGEFELYAQRPYGWIAIAIYLTIVGPAIEEVVFRGRLQPVLIDAFGSRSGLIVTAVLFAAMHGSLGVAPFHLLMGLVYGLAAHRRGSFLMPWTMHVSVNATSFWLTRHFGHSMPPSELANRTGIPPVLFAAISTLAAYLLVAILRVPKRDSQNRLEPPRV